MKKAEKSAIDHEKKEAVADKPLPTPDYTIETSKLDDADGSAAKAEAAA